MVVYQFSLLLNIVFNNSTSMKKFVYTITCHMVAYPFTLLLNIVFNNLLLHGEYIHWAASQ